MKHMTLSEIADACCGIYCGDPAFLDCEVSSVAIDSRKVVKDTLFVAIKGARVDGHSFIPQVMEAGALCSLSEQDLGDVDYPYIRVSSCTEALKDLAELSPFPRYQSCRYHRKCWKDKHKGNDRICTFREI